MTRRANMSNRKTKTIRNIDDKAWHELRIICLREGVSMSEKLNEIIKQAVQAGR
jgi:plasmid stability protein